MTRLAVLVDYSSESERQKKVREGITNALVTGLKPNEPTAALVGWLRLVEVVWDAEPILPQISSVAGWTVTGVTVSLRRRNGVGLLVITRSSSSCQGDYLYCCSAIFANGWSYEVLSNKYHMNSLLCAWRISNYGINCISLYLVWY